MVVILYHSYTRFFRNVRQLIGESRLFRHIVTFLIIAPHKYPYLLIDEFLVDKYI